MITAKEARNIEEKTLHYDIVSNERALLEVYTWICEAAMTSQESVLYENEEYYYHESFESIYVIDMLKSLGYNVEDYTVLDKYGNRESGIRISW